MTQFIGRFSPSDIADLAAYIGPSHTILITRTGAGSGSVASNPAGISCGATCSASFADGTGVTLTATPAAGSVFAGWSDDCSGSGTCTINVSTDISATATFNAVPASFSLTTAKAGAGSGSISSSPAGISCGSTCNTSFNAGTSVTLTAAPAAGSVFGGWSGACSGSNPSCSFTINANASATATFNVAPVSLAVANAGSGTGSVASMPAGINCGATCNASFAPGTGVTLTATPAGGSTFSGWSGACSGSNPSCSFTINGNTGATATFNTAPAAMLTITKSGAGTGSVSSTPAGIACGATCSAPIPTGSNVALKAISDAGSIFTGWSGACSGGNASCSFTLGADASVAATFVPAASIDMRTYVPNAAASGGYVSFVRAINTGATATPVNVARIDGASGTASTSGQLTASLPAGGAATFTAQQVEAAMGISPAASDRPRLRVSFDAAASVEIQSFLLQPGGVFNEVSASQGGSSFTVPTYIPAAGAPSGYQSYLRIINLGAVATPVSIARVDPATGQGGTPVSLIASLPAGAALTSDASQIEGVLGLSLPAGERPTMIVSGNGAALAAQSFLTQPGGAFTNVSGSQSGSSIDVRSYVPASQPGYTTFLRVINNGGSASPVTATVMDGTTGAAGATGTIIASLPGKAAQTLTSAQIESALGVSLPAASRPRLRVASNGGSLTVQSFMLQPGGAFNEFSTAQTGTAVAVRTYIPAADAVTGYTSFLRIINTGAAATLVNVALMDAGGTIGPAVTLIASLPAGGAQSFTPNQVEAALGTTITAGSRPRILVSGNGTNILEVQSFLIQPGGVFTEVSAGQ